MKRDFIGCDIGPNPACGDRCLAIARKPDIRGSDPRGKKDPLSCFKAGPSSVQETLESCDKARAGQFCKSSKTADGKCNTKNLGNCGDPKAGVYKVVEVLSQQSAIDAFAAGILGGCGESGAPCTNDDYKRVVDGCANAMDMNEKGEGRYCMWAKRGMPLAQATHVQGGERRATRRVR